MKKTILYSAFAMMSIALATSCTVSPLGENENPSVAVTSQRLTAYTPAQTKISFTDNGTSGIDLSWVADDTFSVYEPNGKWVADFKYDSESVFAATAESSELIDGANYVALYPARPNNESSYAEYMAHDFTASQTADGSTLDHLNTSCQMSDTFTWDDAAEVNFAHQKAVMTIQFDDIPVDETPSKVTFSDGNNKNYELNLLNMPASTTLDAEKIVANAYVVNLMIDPSEAVQRDLTFTVTHSAGVNVYNIATPIKADGEPVEYKAGARYTAPIMNQNEQLAKGYWTSISSAEELTTYLGKSITKNAILTADIDMSGKTFTPTNIAKIFDGNGYAISNLTITGSADIVGMFANVGSGGTIKNLKLINANIDAKTNQYVGAIAGKVGASGIVTNCSVENVSVSGKKIVGGISGNCASGQITNCYVSGDINSSDVNVGGIVGQVLTNATIADCKVDGNVSSSAANVGGIVGNAASSTIANCEFYGVVETPKTAVGGILGYGGTTPTIYACVNNGTIKGVTKVGGIVGTYTAGGTIVGCYNLGLIGDAVITTGSTAGIIGEAKATVDVIGCYNYSDFGKQPNGGNIGQITGYIKAADAVVTATDCYFVNQGTGKSVQGEECADIAALNEKVEAMNAAINATAYGEYNFIKGLSDSEVPFLMKK